MPRVEVLFYRESDGSVPLTDWLAGLDPGARGACYLRLERLEAWGHELRRPIADYLGDGIYELRVKHQGIHHRMLYFFHGRNAVVVTQGFLKQQSIVPRGEIHHALQRKRAFELDPSKHASTGGD